MHYELHVPVKGIFPSPWVNTNGRCDVHLVHIPYEYFCFAFLAFLSQIFVGKKAPRMNDQGLSLLTSAQAILCCIRSISWCLTAVCHRLVYVVTWWVASVGFMAITCYRVCWGTFKGRQGGRHHLAILQYVKSCVMFTKWNVYASKQNMQFFEGRNLQAQK